MWDDETLVEIGESIGKLILVEKDNEDRCWGTYTKIGLETTLGQAIPQEIEICMEGRI